MRSAWGIDHGVVSKGIPAGLAAAAKKGGFAAERMKAHEEGRFAARLRPAKQYQNQGLPQHHLLDSTRASGWRARAQSRILQPQGKGSLAATNAKKKSPYELFGRGPSGYSGRAKPYSRSA